MRSKLPFLLMLLVTTSADAQILRDLKDAANKRLQNLASKENLEKAANSFLKNMENARAEFDSTDFDYAILISDNAGLFDVKERGERLARTTSMVTVLQSYYNNTELTKEEQARFLRQTGELAYGAGNFAGAEKRFSAAKTIYEEANLTADVGYLKTISNQGLLYTTMGRYTQAESFTTAALDFRQQLFGSKHIGIAASLNNYGVLHYNVGRYNEAEKTLANARAIVEENNLHSSMPYSIILNNQAMLFQAVGRFEEAEQSLKEAIGVAERLQSKKSKNHLKFLSNLALLYQQVGKYQEAESIYLSMERRLGKSNPDYASMLTNQAALYMLMGKDDRVEGLLKNAATIYKSSFGEENPAFARATSDLGNFYRIKGRYSEALPLLEKALAIREKTLGKTHPHYAQSMEDLAILHWKNNSDDKAYTLYKEVMEQSLEFVNTYFPPMSEAEKAKYWDVLSPRFQRFYNFAVESGQEFAKDLFEYQIATKALLLNSTNKVKQSILSSKDGLLIKDYLTWIDQKEQLARLYAYSKAELKEQKINLDSIEQATNAMEKSLSERSKAFQEGYAASRTSFEHIRDLLTDTEVVVEIIRIRKFDQVFTDDAHYVALILRKGLPKPIVKIIENGQHLETRYAKYYRNAVQQKIEDDYSYDQYWAPFDQELAGRRTVYFSPDGVYNQININTLRPSGAPATQYVINRYDVTILGNSRDLISLKKKKAITPSKNATLVGFPDYGGKNITPLPGTKVEIDGISAVLKGSGYKLNVLVQGDATEAKLKAVKSPELLHIATHGYFLEDVQSRGSAFGVNLENASENPLLRSGLMLAGAAKTASGDTSPNLSSNDNGILTAYEAMNMNLEGTQLVVLSACETGLGDVKAGEGVYGLQRAFLVAGADALIMSLWKVDDEATQQLMKNFYANWIKLRNKQKAFKQAQLQLMTKFKDPYYWGAFVMMGQ